jgi:hypothetical protein
MQLSNKDADVLNCKLDKYPISYIVPVRGKQLRVLDWGFLKEKVGHMVDPWQCLFLA